MSGVVSCIGLSQKTTLARREPHDTGGVPLQLRRTSPYPVLSDNVVRGKVWGDSVRNKEVTTVSANSICGSSRQCYVAIFLCAVQFRLTPWTIACLIGYWASNRSESLRIDTCYGLQRVDFGVYR